MPDAHVVSEPLSSLLQWSSSRQLGPNPSTGPHADCGRNRHRSSHPGDAMSSSNQFCARFKQTSAVSARAAPDSSESVANMTVAIDMPGMTSLKGLDTCTRAKLWTAAVLRNSWRLRVAGQLPSRVPVLRVGEQGGIVLQQLCQGLGSHHRHTQGSALRAHS